MKILNEIHLMRGAVISGVESIAIKDLPIPKIKDYEVLVKVKSVGICKTDIEILEGRHPSANELFAKNEPLIPGHEWSAL